MGTGPPQNRNRMLRRRDHIVAKGLIRKPKKQLLESVAPF